MSKEEKEKSPKTFWHHWFGELFRVLLVPLGLEVEIDFAVMAGPPRADILIFRKNSPEWTRKQRKFLPDGIRDADAPRILIELKYSESVNERAVMQTGGYYNSYIVSKELEEKDIGVFLITSMTPQEQVLKDLGYEPSGRPGIYRSRCPVCRKIDLIALNELPDDDRNAPFRLFCSRKKEMLSALEKVKRMAPLLPRMVRGFLTNFLKNVLEKGEKEMDWLNLTPEEKQALGDGLLEMLRSEFPPEQVMSKYKPEERLTGLSPEDRLIGLSPEDRLTGLSPEDRLTGLSPEDRLTGLSPEQIEAYLRKLKGLTEH
jgi:hypothetical protein